MKPVDRLKSELVCNSRFVTINLGLLAELRLNPDHNLGGLMRLRHLPCLLYWKSHDLRAGECNRYVVLGRGREGRGPQDGWSRPCWASINIGLNCRRINHRLNSEPAWVFFGKNAVQGAL